MPVREVRGGQTASFALKKVRKSWFNNSLRTTAADIKWQWEVTGLNSTATCWPFQIKRSQIRKGMVMVSPRLDPKACWEFEGEILVLHHPTTISVKYQAMGEWRDCKITPLSAMQQRVGRKPQTDWCPFLIVICLFLHCSPCGQRTTDSHHPQHVPGASPDGWQSHCPLPLHQKSWVSASRHEAGFPWRQNQSCGHHNQTVPPHQCHGTEHKAAEGS